MLTRATGVGHGEAFRWLRRDIDHAVARRSPKRLLVHAGVVGWRGVGIVIPGRRSTGKSTLVTELVRRGAVYYSDAFAVLDEAGRVHPYRPHILRLVQEDGPSEPLPIGLIVAGPYQSGSAWRPTIVRGAHAALSLLDGTILAREAPASMLQIVARVASTVVTLRGPRPEATVVAAQLLDLVDDGFARYEIDVAGNGSSRLTDHLARVAEVRRRSHSGRPMRPSPPPEERLSRLLPTLQELVEWQSWSSRGRPVPPPHPVKVRLVKQYAGRYQLTTLVETGTYQGAMVRALLPCVDRIYSIELDDHWYGLAREAFAGSPKVTVLHGDSGTVLRRVLATIDRPCLFWLDAHYSGHGTAKGSSNTPIMQELSAVLDHGTPGHVVLIDDARDFTGLNGYPTLDQVRSVVLTAYPGCRFDVEDDIVRVTATA